MDSGGERIVPPRRGICKSYTLERIFQLLNAACESMPRYNFVHFPKKGA